MTGEKSVWPVNKSVWPVNKRYGGCVMANYLIMAAMKGRFMSEQGNLYDNFQMLGYMEGASPFDAVAAFFDQPKFPIVWADVEYMWAERLADDPANGHHGEYDKVYIASLRERWEGSSRN